MPWPDDAEVAAVERRHFSGVEPLRCRDHRGVDGAERQVSVLSDELGDANGVAGVQRLDREAAAGEVAEEASLSLPAQPGSDQIGDLSDDEGRDDERSRMGLEQLQAGGVVGVVGVDVRAKQECCEYGLGGSEALRGGRARLLAQDSHSRGNTREGKRGQVEARALR